MALVKCHDCNAEISTSVFRCPNCGALTKSTQKRQMGCAIAMLLPLVLVVLALIFAESESDFASYEDPLEYWMKNSTELENIVCSKQEDRLLGEWGSAFSEMIRKENLLALDFESGGTRCINLYDKTFVIHHVTPLVNITRSSSQTGLVVTAMAGTVQSLLEGLASLPKNESIETVVIQIYAPAPGDDNSVEYAFTVHLWADTIYKNTSDEWFYQSPSKTIESVLEDGGKYQVEDWLLQNISSY